MKIKTNILRISLVLLLAAAGILCVYAVSNYQSDAALAPNMAAPRNSQPVERNRQPEMTNKTPQGQSPERNAGQRPFGTSGGRMGEGNTGGGSDYAPQLITYAILFLVLFTAAYYLITHKKLGVFPGNEKILILTILCCGLLVRVFSATLMEGHPFDLSLFRNWATAAADNLFQVYANSRSIDYPPLYLYVLYVVGKLAGITALSPYFTLLLKLPSIAADIATAFLIYKLARKYLSAEISILAASFYVFNPAVLINSTFWGQVDSFFTLIVTAAVFLLSEKKTGPATALFAAAVLMKPQGMIFLPVLFFELVRQKNLKSFVSAAAFALSTVVLIVLPFALSQGALWIVTLFSGTLAKYPYASVNAFNFFSLLGANYTRDLSTLFLFSYHSWGMIFIVIITAFSWLIYIKGNSRLFIAAAALLQIAGVFTFSARIHERYLFPAVALAILAFIDLKDKLLLLLSAGFSAAVYINTHYILYWTSKGVHAAPYGPALIITSVLNIFLFGYLAKILYDIAVKKKNIPVTQQLIT